MSNSGLTFDVTDSYLSYTNGNSAECLNACIESNNCSGAIYVHEASNNRMCTHFASCDNVDCMVTETDPSPGKKKYLIKCNQGTL